MPGALESCFVRILFVGDVVGKPGVQFLTGVLPGIRRLESIELAVVNAENADGGSGINPGIYRRLVAAGADCITLGDHIYKKKEIIDALHDEIKLKDLQVIKLKEMLEKQRRDLLL